MLDEIPDGEYAGQSRVFTAFDLGKSCVRQIEKGKALYRNKVEPCSTPLPIDRARSVNRLRWLHMVCVDIRVLCRLGVSVTVLVDGLHWSHRCLRRIRQSFDDVVPGGSVLRGWFQVVPIIVCSLWRWWFSSAPLLRYSKSRAIKKCAFLCLLIIYELCYPYIMMLATGQAAPIAICQTFCLVMLFYTEWQNLLL